MRSGRTGLLLVASMAVAIALMPGAWSSADELRETDGGIATPPTPLAVPTAAGQPQEQHPPLQWSFDRQDGPDRQPADMPLRLEGDAAIVPLGPSGRQFEGMPESNLALRLDGDGDFARLTDPGPHSPLDFDDGDPITLEAWVRIDSLSNGANVYVVGKGRTYLNGSRENQNYALRLRGAGGQARVSFLFRSRATAGLASDAKDKKGDDQDDAKQGDQYHRWTSDLGFLPDGYWHHVAVSYRFGSPKAIRGYVDGAATGGKWDMGGATTLPPVCDDDELWIGSACGGSSGNSLRGEIDQVLVHRRIVTDGELGGRRIVKEQPPQWDEADGLDSAVVVRLHAWPRQSPEAEQLSYKSWPLEPPPVVAEYRQNWFAISRVPRSYAPGGLRDDPRPAVLVTAATEVALPRGDIEWLVRSAGLCRVWMDGRVVATTPPHKLATNGHGAVVPYQSDQPRPRQPRPGDEERRWTSHSDGSKIRIALETLVGAPDTRSEPGDITIAARLANSDMPWQIIGPTDSVPLNDAGWRQVLDHVHPLVDAIDAASRRQAATVDDGFWQRRHQRARRFIDDLPAIELPATSLPTLSPVDHFVGSRIEASADGSDDPQATLPPLIDDLTFLRRAFLDTVGVPPSLQEIESFLATPAERRRNEWIDRLLDDPRWADHWTSYWQDVLAENPNIIKPSLNNTGPFRWFLYEALLDHKPIDRWVTELVRMEGSRYGGGPAGFGMAAQNDVPMAAKAHVLSAAFLAVDMQCARCHDAPYHDWKQRDLFSLAAMLERKPLTVPPTSSVPKAFFDRRGPGSLITVSTQPGEQVDARWPLPDLVDPQSIGTDDLDRDGSSREQLAALMTTPENRRFAEVVANRVWQRLMGEGIVEPLDDWDGARPSDPLLLDYLGRQLTRSGYDVRQVMRLIMHSHAYQRRAEDRPRRRQADQRLFVAPRLRRMTAEQVVDSLHAVCRLPMMSEELTFDPESRMRNNVYLNLGKPRRAWQLTSLSNERDRPALSLPEAATLVECLEAFGWPAARQAPIEHREEEPNVIQPGLLANGAMSTRLTRLTDDAPLTQLCIDATTPEQLVESLFLQVLTRQPTDAERQLFVEAFAAGFADRVVASTTQAPPTLPPLPAVTWANHLSAEASEIMQQIERRVQAGPQPTAKLQDAWRQRAEDAIWALLNAPEMQFVP